MRTPELLSALIDLLLPPRCAFCGALLRHGESCCPACADIHPQVLPRILGAGNEGAVDCYAAFPYADRPREAMIRFKFCDFPQVAATFGKVLAQLLREALPDAGAFSCVCAVPMGAAHRWRRGYNQSELLARKLASELALPYRALLRRVRHCRQQHSLHAQARVENVRNAFAARRAVPAWRVLLVDDIVTTGSTLGECAAALLRAGAQEVVCVALCDALHQDDSIAQLAH